MSAYSATAAAKELGISRQAMEQRLNGCGLKADRGKRFTLRQIVDAMMSKNNDREGILKARREKLEEEAKLTRLERQEKERELVQLSECLNIIRSSFVPVRQRLMALPAEAAPRCNPSDPEHARDALQQWVDGALSRIREELPKAKEEEPTPE